MAEKIIEVAVDSEAQLLLRVSRNSAETSFHVSYLEGFELGAFHMLHEFAVRLGSRMLRHFVEIDELWHYK